MLRKVYLKPGQVFISSDHIILLYRKSNCTYECIDCYYPRGGLCYDGIKKDNEVMVCKPGYSFKEIKNGI